MLNDLDNAHRDAEQNIADIANVAEEYLDKSEAELNELFDHELRISESQTTRPDETKYFWQQILDNVTRRVSRRKDTSPTTVSFVASELLGVLTQAGVSLSQYKLPISILVAIITRTVRASLAGDSSTNAPPPDVKKKKDKRK
jgi:hypothetical protein